MNRLTVTATIAWLLGIFVLWFMIKIDSDDLTWLQLGTSEPAAVPATESLASYEPNPIPLSCEETENSLRDRIEAARYCATDSECTLFDFGYPIECMMSVAKSEITTLRGEYRIYEKSCDFRVYFDCPSEPMYRRAICQENRCSVSLQTIDNLEEETLEYLGLGRPKQKR